MPNEIKVSRLLSKMLGDAENDSLSKKHKSISYIRQKNILLASYFSMSTVDQMETGISFDLVEENEKSYLRINHIVRVPIYDKYEWHLLMLMFEGELIINKDKIIKEKVPAVMWVFKRWRPMFAEKFGLSQPFNYTLMRHLRMLSMIRDNHAPELDVLSLFGYHTNKLIARKTLGEAQESLLQHTKGIRYEAMD